MTKLVLIFIALFIIGIESAPGDRILRDSRGIARDRNSLIRKGNQDFWGKIFGQSNIDDDNNGVDDDDDDDETKPIEPKKKPVDEGDDDDDVDEKDDDGTDDDDDVAKPKKNEKKPVKKPQKPQRPQRPQKPEKPTKPENPQKDVPSYVLVPVRKGKVSIVYPNGKVVTKDIKKKQDQRWENIDLDKDLDTE